MSQTYDVISVEDDDDLFSLLQLLLKDEPLKFRRARSGAEALTQLATTKPDLLLLDLTLPDMRGWEVLDKAAAAQTLDGVPVVVLTSHTEAPHRIIGKMQEVAAYISKPFNPIELRKTLQRALGYS